MPKNEAMRPLPEPEMNQKAQLGLKKAYAKLIVERSQTGGSILKRRNGDLVEVPAVDLLPEAKEILAEVETQLKDSSKNWLLTKD